MQQMQLQRWLSEQQMAAQQRYGTTSARAQMMANTTAWMVQYQVGSGFNPAIGWTVSA